MIAMIAKFLILLGLLLDIVGVCMLATALVSGRKGRLNDLQTTMEVTMGVRDQILFGYERKIKPVYPEDEYAKIIQELNAEREAVRNRIQEEIDALERLGRTKGFWTEVKGLILVVVGFIFQFIGTLLMM